MNPRTTASVGVFAALAYAGSFLLLAVPNATLSLLIVFFAGYLLGRSAGVFTGVVSSLLISLFNPYGLPLLPLLVAQVVAYAAIGLLGGVCRNVDFGHKRLLYLLWLAFLGLLTALVYQVPVSVIDAYLFGPFWERLVMSGGFALVTIASNMVFFILLFPVLANLKKLPIFHGNHAARSHIGGMHL